MKWGLLPSFLRAYKRSRGSFLRGSSSPVLRICLTPKSSLTGKQPCHLLPRSSSHTLSSIQILANPELLAPHFSKTVAIPQLWAAFPQTPSYPEHFFLQILSLPQSLGFHSRVLLRDSTVLLFHEQSNLFWHLQLHLLSISYFACLPFLVSLPGFQWLVVAAADKVPVFSTTWLICIL